MVASAVEELGDGEAHPVAWKQIKTWSGSVNCTAYPHWALLTASVVDTLPQVNCIPTHETRALLIKLRLSVTCRIRGDTL